MRRILIFIFLILSSCQRDELLDIEPVVEQSMIFDEIETLIQDGEAIRFNTPTSSPHTLLLINPINNSVISKENFTSIEGTNQRNIFTRVLPKQKLKLVLLKGSEEINSTFIIVE